MSPKRFVLFALLAAANAHADPFVYTVGAEPLIGEDGVDDGACVTHSIQEAIERAKAREGFDIIHIANDQTYTAQELVLDEQDVQIVGGYASCSASNRFDPPTGRTVPSGAGGANAPVLKLRGKIDVELRNLEMWGGDHVSLGYGGAMHADRFTFVGNEAARLFFAHPWGTTIKPA